jgi:hypothetical protein
MKNLFKFLLLFFAASLFAQNNQRFFQKIEFKNNTAEISVNDGLYQVNSIHARNGRNAFIPKIKHLQKILTP